MACLVPYLFVQTIPVKMGYELNRFQGDVDEELICPICSGVLEEPLQVKIYKLLKYVDVTCVIGA